MALWNREVEASLLGSSAGLVVTCASGSMEPTIRVGQRVRMSAPNAFRVGDVVLFAAKDGAWVLHRLLAKIPGRNIYVQGGDAPAEAAPGLIMGDEIRGIAHEFYWPVPLVLQGAFVAKALTGWAKRRL